MAEWRLDQAAFSARVRRLRKARGLTIDQLVISSGLSRSYLSRLENKQVQEPTYNDLAKLADGLEMTLDDLLGRPDPGEAGRYRRMADDPEAETYLYSIEKGLRRADPREQRLAKGILRSLADDLDTPELPGQSRIAGE